MIPCVFSQRQGYITIRRSDGVKHDLSPVADVPGDFRDNEGHPVYRQSDLGDQGLVFRFPNESVYVYWSTSIFNENAESSPTAPFSTRDYDATTLLRCRAIDQTEFANCPAGILRMEDGQASIIVQNQSGEQFTINFMSDYINAGNRVVKATLNGDTWTVTIDDQEIYQVPLAAIEGG